MKVQLISKPVREYNATTQIFLNRGLKPNDFKTYFNSTDDNINSPLLLEESLLKRGAKMLLDSVSQYKKILVVVDADCDGYTSSALLINYMYELWPVYVLNHVKWFIHSGKQHGLNDCIDIAMKYDMVILPDSSSGDASFHERLAAKGIDVLVLDHHESNIVNYDVACVINNQLCEYPNKELSGVGITWQFCRYIDSLINKDIANNFLDLVALGNVADMQSMLSIETKHLIFKGFQTDNVRNPFIFTMAQKNSFSLNKADYKPSAQSGLQFSPMGAAFFIAPFVNAMVRSGTQEEKELLFDSMLIFKAFDQIPSTKRGHKLGEMERRVDQAIRVCTNVKNRQTKAQDEGVEYLENQIEKYNMLQHKILLFLLEPGEIDKNIAGLIATKFAAKYQRPCCILTKVVEETEEGKRTSYQGSARGYDAVGITNFKDLCAGSTSCIYAAGHQSAFGLGLGYDYEGAEEVNGEFIYQFLDYIDEKLKDVTDEPIYYVDYIWNATAADGEKILEIANLNNYLGKDFDRPIVMIKDLEVTQDNFKIMKSNTLKFQLPCGIDMIKFGGTEDEITIFNTGVTINAICKCCANEWNWNIDPQLQLLDYEIIKKKESKGVMYDWNF